MKKIIAVLGTILSCIFILLPAMKQKNQPVFIRELSQEKDSCRKAIELWVESFSTSYAQIKELQNVKITEETFENLKKRFEEKDKSLFIIVAEKEEIIVGAIAFTKLSEGTAYIDQLGVTTKEQGQGIGIRLTLAIETFTGEKKPLGNELKQILFFSRKQNPAIKLYKKLGAEKSDVLRINHHDLSEEYNPEFYTCMEWSYNEENLMKLQKIIKKNKSFE